MAQSNPEFVAALETLETRLETPVVPGDLASWIDEACAALDAAGKQLHAQIGNAHREQLKEILRQDKELATRVEQMQQQDVSLLEQLDEVRRIAHELRAGADRIE